MDRTGATTRWRVSLVRVTSLRYVILALVGVAFGVVAGGHGDWDFFTTAGRAMLGHDGLSVFALHHDVQTGPITLLLARALAGTPRGGFVACAIVCGALGLVAIRCLERARDPERAGDEQGTELTVLIGGILVMFWWAKLGGYGHLDDALVLAAAAVALLEVRRGRPLVAAVFIGLAIATKPWAIALIPMTLGPTGSFRERLRGPITGVAIGLALWLPFFIAEPDTMQSLRTTVNVSPDSVLHLFGMSNDSVPNWLRSAQLLGAIALASVAAWRGRIGGVMLAAIAFRMMTDPGTWSYYTAGFMLGALAWDLYETRSVMPRITIAASCLLVPPWIIHANTLSAVLRLVACLAAIALVLGSPARPRQGSAEHTVGGAVHGALT